VRGVHTERQPKHERTLGIFPHHGVGGETLHSVATFVRSAIVAPHEGHKNDPSTLAPDGHAHVPVAPAQ
jgi:hypothetical protein